MYSERRIYRLEHVLSLLVLISETLEGEINSAAISCINHLSILNKLIWSTKARHSVISYEANTI